MNESDYFEKKILPLYVWIKMVIEKMTKNKPNHNKFSKKIL